ncbi:30S ribosomal protein S2 [bacterium]|nr:30S ribosomal protein S2 [bacterium]|tara:strand:- start:889 stop:1650 length:762 start_codon:yes stop_codon:yes gene_type:complete
MNTETKNTDTNLIDRLFSVGAHFGFSKSRRHPTAKPYIFGNKQGTDIFDLEKTSELIVKAKVVLEEAGKNGHTVLFVSTKDETSPIVKEAAVDAESPYVTNRWIGGTLTNFGEIKKRIARLSDLTSEGERGELERKYTKKERVVIGREAEKLQFNFGGIKNMDRLPNLMVVVDPRHDAIAVQEAHDTGVPVIGIMSSDNNASLVKYPVMVNDALQASVSLVVDELISALKAGKAAYVPKAVKSTDRRRSFRQN